jgi:hypothetical protein
VPEPLLPIGAIRTTVVPGSGVPVWASPTALAIYGVLTAVVAGRVFTRKDITA